MGLADNLKPTFASSADSVEFETGTGTGTAASTPIGSSVGSTTPTAATTTTQQSTTRTTTTSTTAAPTTSSSSSSTSTTASTVSGKKSFQDLQEKDIAIWNQALKSPKLSFNSLRNKFKIYGFSSPLLLLLFLSALFSHTPQTRPPTTKTTKATALPTVGVNGTGSVQATAITTSSSSSSSSASSTLHTTNGKQAPGWRQGNTGSSNGSQHKPQRPPLVLGYPPQRGTRIDDTNEVQVKHAFRQDSSVIIQWDSETANILGFRVVYRLFGEKAFKQGPPLEASEREFKIKNVPAQECIIVCVISLEELHVTPETVPYQQCREVRTVSSQTSNMDKITIAASAAICGTIIVAVIVFIAASR